MLNDDVASQIRDTSRAFLSRAAAQGPAVGELDQRAGSRRWKAAAELGWPGIEIPEKFGGGGGSFANVCVLLEELGRYADDLPIWSTVAVAIRALADANARQQELWYPRIAAGEAVIAAAITNSRGLPDGLGVGMQSVTGGWLLSGEARWILDLPRADAVLLAAHDPDACGPSLFLAPTGLDGLVVAAETTTDLARQVGHLSCHGLFLTADHLIGQSGHAAALLDQLRNRAAVALAADSLGGASRVLEMTLDHLKTRHQFGRPIGSFQALKHRCASSFVDIELARAAVEFAARLAVITQGAASIAKEQADDAFRHAAAENVQLHGAMGFTWEYPAHLYLRRASLNAALHGNPLWHRDRLSELLLQAHVTD